MSGFGFFSVILFGLLFNPTSLVFSQNENDVDNRMAQVRLEELNKLTKRKLINALLPYGITQTDLQRNIERERAASLSRKKIKNASEKRATLLAHEVIENNKNINNCPNVIQSLQNQTIKCSKQRASINIRKRIFNSNERNFFVESPAAQRMSLDAEAELKACEIISKQLCNKAKNICSNPAEEQVTFPVSLDVMRECFN